jgi:hypothetical protein
MENDRQGMHSHLQEGDRGIIFHGPYRIQAQRHRPRCYPRGKYDTPYLLEQRTAIPIRGGD